MIFQIYFKMRSISRTLTGAWFFYKKMAIPIWSISILIGFLDFTGPSIGSIGMAEIFVAPVMHFLIYELGNQEEYYFYYNIGFTKVLLWGITLGVGVMVGLIMIFI
jgi:hypothetical protein